MSDDRGYTTHSFDLCISWWVSYIQEKIVNRQTRMKYKGRGNEQEMKENVAGNEP